MSPVASIALAPLEEARVAPAHYLSHAAARRLCDQVARFNGFIRHGHPPQP